MSTISYYGFSYGTYLGQVYSTLYPTHLKYMVLDSNVDPRKVWYQANLDQDRAFDRNIHIYFRWVAKYNRVYHLGSTEKARRGALHPRALRADQASGRPARPGRVRRRDGRCGLLHLRLGGSRERLAVLRHARPYRRDDPAVRRERPPGNDNEFAVYNAVQCTDAQWPTTWSRWRKDNDAYYKKYPFLTWNNAWFNSPCLYWGAKAHQPLQVNGNATKSALLIDETLDAATPY